MEVEDIIGNIESENENDKNVKDYRTLFLELKAKNT